MIDYVIQSTPSIVAPLVDSSRCCPRPITICSLCTSTADEMVCYSFCFSLHHPLSLTISIPTDRCQHWKLVQLDKDVQHPQCLGTTINIHTFQHRRWGTWIAAVGPSLAVTNFPGCAPLWWATMRQVKEWSTSLYNTLLIIRSAIVSSPSKCRIGHWNMCGHKNLLFLRSHMTTEWLYFRAFHAQQVFTSLYATLKPWTQILVVIRDLYDMWPGTFQNFKVL